MAKNKTIFVCSGCGYESPKWMGKCPGCNSWNTMVEQRVTKTTKVFVNLSHRHNIFFIKVYCF